MNSIDEDSTTIEGVAMNEKVPLGRLHGTQCKVVARTKDPNFVIYMAMHQDYSGKSVVDMIGDDFGEGGRSIDERKCGSLIVKSLLSGDKGHYGPLEHPAITIACKGFPHSVMQQARTHRIGVSFDVQSFRYTGDHIVEVVDKWLPREDKMISEDWRRDVESLIYYRAVGPYPTRSGYYHYGATERRQDIVNGWEQLVRYRSKRRGSAVGEGSPAEQARSTLPFDIRQHFVVSFNLRSLLHFLDLRQKADAQYEIRCFANDLAAIASDWVPEIYQWYEKHRGGKARLAP